MSLTYKESIPILYQKLSMCIGQLFCDIDDFFIEYEQQMASKPLPV